MCVHAIITNNTLKKTMLSYYVCTCHYNKQLPWRRQCYHIMCVHAIITTITLKKTMLSFYVCTCHYNNHYTEEDNVIILCVYMPLYQPLHWIRQCYHVMCVHAVITNNSLKKTMLSWYVCTCHYNIQFPEEDNGIILCVYMPL